MKKLLLFILSLCFLPLASTAQVKLKSNGKVIMGEEGSLSNSNAAATVSVYATGRAEEPVEPHVYLPLFGENETSYNVYTETYHEVGTDSICYVEDKIVNGLTYKYFESKKVFCGGSYLIRTTEDNSKVYCLDDDLEEEILTFDLSLKKGDHFTYYHPSGEIDCTVDTVYIDKLDRKNIHLSSHDHYDPVYLVFIEGIGSSAGIFYNRNYYSIFGTFLLCSWKDGAASYHFYEDISNIKEINEEYRNYWPLYLLDWSPFCSMLIINTEDIALSGDWLIYPNPFADTFYIENNMESICSVSMFDSIGKLILQKGINDMNAQIYLSAPAGTYHVYIITETGKRYHQKIVKL